MRETVEKENETAKELKGTTYTEVYERGYQPG
jgi:hypothetical protein